MNIPKTVATLISEDIDEVKENFAAVAIVSHGNKWLLGLSTSDGDRKNKWVFPGGHIKDKEEAKTAAERECREETHILCKSTGRTTTLPDKPGVIFVRCRATTTQFKPNHEFSAIGWFTRYEMRSLKLYRNVYKLIDKLT